MSNLKDCFKPTKNNNSSKTPQMYGAERKELIIEGATSPDARVRQFFASNRNTPTKVLVAMLKIETDKQVLRTILFNSRLPRTQCARFVHDETDERVEWFEDDVELTEHFTK